MDSIEKNMMPGIEEKREGILFPSQKESIERALSNFDAAQPGEPVLVIIKGISGSGKSEALEQMKDEIESRGVVTVNDFGNQEEFRNDRLHYIVTDTINPSNRECNAIIKFKEVFPEGQVVEEPFKTLTDKEAEDFFDLHINGEGAKKFKAEIIDSSLGIPGLMKDIGAMDLGEKDFDYAQKLAKGGKVSMYAALRLVAHFGEKILEKESEIKQFISKVDFTIKDLPFSEAVKLSRFNVYEQRLPKVMDMWVKKYRDLGEPSPEFVAPESPSIYKRILTEYGMHGGSEANLEIHTSYLSPLQRTMLSNSLSISFKGFSISNRSNYIAYGSIGVSKRSSMFSCFGNAGSNKVGAMISFKDPEKKDVYVATDDHNWEPFRAVKKDFLDSQLPNNEVSGEDMRLDFYTMDHSGGPIFTRIPSENGWMVESLYQQLGVSYLVYYDVLKETYKFDPENKKMLLIKK